MGPFWIMTAMYGLAVALWCVERVKLIRKIRKQAQNIDSLLRQINDLLREKYRLGDKMSASAMPTPWSDYERAIGITESDARCEAQSQMLGRK